MKTKIECICHLNKGNPTIIWACIPCSKKYFAERKRNYEESQEALQNYLRDTSE